MAYQAISVRWLDFPSFGDVLLISLQRPRIQYCFSHPYLPSLPLVTDFHQSFEYITGRFNADLQFPSTLQDRAG